MRIEIRVGDHRGLGRNDLARETELKLEIKLRRAWLGIRAEISGRGN